MKDSKSLNLLISELKERAKELTCLYQVQELLNNAEITEKEICESMLTILPKGWQYSDICCAKINLLGQDYYSDNCTDTLWVQEADILLQNERIGKICVCYTELRPQADEGPFLKEERKLIDTIADRLGQYILHKKLKTVFEEQKHIDKEERNEWVVIFDMLRQTDLHLLIRLSRKMVNYLCWTGIKEAQILLEQFSPWYENKEEALVENRPFKKHSENDLVSLGYKIYELAGNYMTQKQILDSIHKWTKEDRSGFLANVLENTGSSLQDIDTTIERYYHLAPNMLDLSEQREHAIRVALIRRLLTDQSDYISIAKRNIDVKSFNQLMQHVIYPEGSHGKLGGKSAGLFLAEHILKNHEDENELFKNVKIPKTWYISSDSLLTFIEFNDLEEVMEQKYKDIGQVRQEYPFVIQVFKNSSFSPEIIKGLSSILDDLKSVPLVVRSSSLLEDRIGAAFAGKYKSLFIANQGTKEERLMQLLDAIAEVYASIFGPDPIDYRAENDLLDYHEEMGIIIQEVVGTTVGHYYFPAFAGVAFSRNEFRWSPRIKREDGLIRMVPGLGTRAVDRTSNDYPILISPGQPNLKVNVSIDEIIRYSPRYIDLINLKTGEFETVEVADILKEFGNDYPAVYQVISVLKQGHFKKPRPMSVDFKNDNFAITFEGLITQTDFVKQVKDILDILQKQYHHPVDIEFAHDGKHFYLLQCRSQNAGIEYKPAAIPSNISAEKIIFSANRFVSNGLISDITHIVYVDPKKYSEVSDLETLREVGKAIGRLNKILPKRQFILMGPGRWGSRGDIKLGVNVTYSEINNTMMLIEIARRTKDYVPDVSFGTHFFQDLVEANIRYQPLYPDDRGIVFNEEFLINSENTFTSFLPDLAYLADIIRVIDVPASTNGKVMQVLMNGEIGEMIAILVNRSELPEEDELQLVTNQSVRIKQSDIHWQWRLRNVEKLAAQLDPKKFGVKAFYVFGSVKNALAGPASDIDILIHFIGNEKQRNELLLWLEGWSLALGQINFLRTGYKTDGLLDIHIITDEDIKKRDSFAIKIGAVSDPARPLPLGVALPE